ncbi:Uma2 family endonuclease [Myxococcota bacterium]|nr:Uma2 family endonuclease [Myxococcota bacterium]
MSKSALPYDPADVPVPDVDAIVTEDDTPVDNLASEKQQRLLTESLYASWACPGGRRFLAAANVGLFPTIHRPPLVPDVFVSLDVEVPEDWWAKRHRSYFVWEFGKAPDVVIEIVSNLEGNEAGSKLADYARAGVPYYAIFDPQRLLSPEPLRVYESRGGAYELRPDARLPRVGLGLALWAGEYEGKHTEWLRWLDAEGNLIATGVERANSERERANTERERANSERERANTERSRAERLAERLRALGIDPDTDG